MTAVRSGLDVLRSRRPALLAGRRVGLLAHPASVTHDLAHAADVIRSLRRVRLTALFAPEHGLAGVAQDHARIGTEYDRGRRLRVHSLYGKRLEPTSAMLRDLDVLVVDLQDVGARYYTFAWTMVLAMRACARAGKPVIVSMGDVAGSGGYYIAAPADKIVAQPATLTGSIGVLAGKLVIAGLLDKLGAATDSVQQGANAAMFSPFVDFSPVGRARLGAFLDATYRGFKERVAAGRHMSADQVEAVAKGDGVKPKDIVYARCWRLKKRGAAGLVPGPGGHDLPAEGQRVRAYLARGKYDPTSQEDNGFAAVYPNGIETLAKPSTLPTTISRRVVGLVTMV